MAYTESSSQGWLSRLWESITGVLVGIVLFLIAFPLLFWNEGRAVHRAQGLAAGKSQVISASAGKVDPANEGKLIHLTGLATTEDTLSDPDFKISADHALRLQRKVEMFQWKEDDKKKTRKKLGGGEETVTVYTYEQVWSDELLKSSEFHRKGHENPTDMAWPSKTWQAEKSTIGAFTLGALAEQMTDWQKVSATKPEQDLKAKDGMLYSGVKPESPQNGDLRISFSAVEPAKVSVIALQRGDGFDHFDSGAGDGGIFDLSMGEKTSDQMFQQLESQNSMLTWILRAVGFFLMVIGISMVFRPLSVVADVVPLFGNLLEAGLGFVAFGLAIPFTLVTIALGWIAYRPLLGIGLLLAAGAVIFFAFKAARAKKAS